MDGGLEFGALIQTETLELLEWSRLCQHLSTFAATKLGAAAARQLQIPDSRAVSEQLLAQTREIYHLETLPTGGLSFEGIHDIGEALERSALKGILTGAELIAIALTLAGMRNLRRMIDNQPNVPTLAALVSELRTYPELEQAIHRCIDDQGRVSDRASLKLAEIRDRLRRLRQEIYQKLQNILQQKAGAVQEPTITQRHDRFVIPVKAPQKDAIPGIVHDTSTSGATLYVEPNSTVPMNNQLQQLLRQEQAEEEAVRRVLTEQVAEVQADLEQLLAIATILDLATARARYSLWLDANPPRFIDFGLPILEFGLDDSDQPTSNIQHPTSADQPKFKIQNPKSEDHPKSKIQNPKSEPITLRQLRHPLLVWQQQHEQGNAVVPIDLIIQPTIRVVAITGPNTGGKTATLKTLGLAALMAKAGLFIPAREPVEIPWFAQILADIGDEQSLQQNLSTFSGHIRRISRILEQISGARFQVSDEQVSGVRCQVSGEDLTPSTPDTRHPTPHAPHPTPHTLSNTLHPSLILLDEVGAGTDPSEGSALAIALLQHLAERVQLTVATTHFGELKALKYQDARFENASVEFDDASLSPTYRLLWGIPGRSNALAIARRLGLPNTVVDRAQDYVGGFSQDINHVISGLEAQRRDQEAKAKAAADLLVSAEQFYQKVSDKAKSLQARERDLQVAQEQAVQVAIVQAKAEIASVIRQLQQGPATAQAAQQATQTLDHLAQQHLPSRHVKPAKANFMPKVGDRIRIPSLNQTAEVLAVNDPDHNLTVRFGIMKMTVPLDDVESLDGQKVSSVKGQGTGDKGQAESRERTPHPTPHTPHPTTPRTPHSAPHTPHPTPTPSIRTSRNTLDLRGSRVADAEPVLDKALAEGDSVLWIIHGHGTGKLRQGIHEFLKQHPSVSHFTLADPQDGGAGVTIAYLT